MSLPKRIQNHEAHCLRAVTTRVYRDPVTALPVARDCGTATSLAVFQRTTKRPQISSGDRILWSWFSRCWSGWRDAMFFVQTETMIAWQGKRFRDHWAKLSRHGRPGRPQVPKEIRVLIRKMSEANTSWGLPHWQHPARLPGPCCGVERASSETNLDPLF